MKRKHIITRIGVLALMIGTAVIGTAQSSLPAPGSGGGFQPGGIGGNSLPAPGSGGGFRPGGGPGPGMTPPPPIWGSPWNGGGLNLNISVGSPGWQNQGAVTVMGCGYDTMGVWRTIPLRVAYSWNGVQYNVTVVNAWNPWTDVWNRGIDMPAYNTNYFINGQTYNFYTPLSTGTYYFNL